MPRIEKTASRPEFVYFDLGNVLLNFSHQLACEQIANIAQLPVERVWKTIFETPLVGQYELGKVSDQQFHAGFCDATGSQIELEPFLLAFSDIFWLNDPVLSMAVELNRGSVSTGILSNTCSSHWNFANLRFPSLFECFATNILSFEEASTKPDRKIFDAAIRQAKISPEYIFFVDDRAENVAGARAAGLDAVIFESVSQLRQELNRRGLLLN